MAVTLPSLILAITAFVSRILQNATGKVEVSGISNILFIIGLFVIAIAVMAFLTVEIGRKEEIKKGIGFGIFIAIAIAIIEFGLLEWLGGV